VRLVICDLSASPHVDLAGSRMLHELHDKLGDLDIGLRIVAARGRVRDLLHAEGLCEKVGELDRLLQDLGAARAGSFFDLRRKNESVAMSSPTYSTERATG